MKNLILGKISLTSRLIIGLVCFPFLHACSNSGEGVNPGLVELPLVYAKRTIPLDADGVPLQPDLRAPIDPRLFSPGGDVYIRDYSSVSSPERNLTLIITGGTGDVRDIESSYEGDKIIFSLRLEDPDPNDDVVPKWGIYEYNFETDQLRRVITDDSKAAEGNDISPYYLPDGRIVFSSDRQYQSKGVLTDEGTIGLGKPQYSAVDEERRSPAFVLHVMDANGENIHQISFNQSHDLDPVVLSNGRILFSRWEGAGNNNTVNLFTVNPDGSDLQIYYGDAASSHRDARGNTLHFTQPRVLADGRVLVLARPFTNSYGGGDLWIVDGQNYVDINLPTYINQNIMSGPGQVKATTTNVISNGISVAGRYAAAYPLVDGTNRVIVSKGTCQLTTDELGNPDVVVQLHPCIEPYLSDQNMTEMPPAYGLWIFNFGNGTERPLIAGEPGYMLTDPVIVQPRTRPVIIYDKDVTGELNQTLRSQGVGILHIRSVYDMGDGVFNCRFLNVACNSSNISSLEALASPTVLDDVRPARFIRLIKPVSLPDQREPGQQPNPRNTDFGPNVNLRMREIIGYAMVEPDGSVKVKVPANVAFGIEVLDKDGRRIGRRHDSWLQVNAGDTLNCIGCHEVNNAPLPHGRSDAVPVSINYGAPYDGYVYTGTRVPNPDPANITPYYGDGQQTMAEVRTRTIPSAIDPSVDIVYTNDWISPLPDTTAFSYSYTAGAGLGLSTQIPTSTTCTTAWQKECRIVINYIEHIQPLWKLDRGANTCTTCHTTNNNTQIPAGQLDLTGGVSDEEPDHIESYQDLLFDDNLQTLANGVLVDVLITRPAFDENGNPVLDANGNQVLETVPLVNPESRSMSANGARSSYFMEKMTNAELDATRTLGGTVNHLNFMTPAELKLIAEWLDIGAQYYNDPYNAAIPRN